MEKEKKTLPLHIKSVLYFKTVLQPFIIYPDSNIVFLTANTQ